MQLEHLDAVMEIEQRAYEYCSAGQIHQWSQVPGSLPLFETILVFQNRPASSSTPETSARSIDMDRVLTIGAQTRYALVILATPGSKLEFRLVYDSYRLDNAAITQILEHLTVVLCDLVAASEQTTDTAGAQAPRGRTCH